LPTPRPLRSLSRTGAVNRTSIAYDALKESIFINKLKPGDHISENQVAQSLGMSRTPVREAIKVLASEGLVEIHNGVGIFVKQITTKEISDLFEVRAALECAALHTALECISDQELDAINEKWMKLKKKMDGGAKGDLSHLLDLDFQFHSLIVEICFIAPAAASTCSWTAFESKGLRSRCLMAMACSPSSTSCPTSSRRDSLT